MFHRLTKHLVKNTPLGVVFSTLFSVFVDPDEPLSGVFDILLLTLKKKMEHLRWHFIIFLNAETRAENATRSGAFLTDVDVFGSFVKLSRIAQ